MDCFHTTHPDPALPAYLREDGRGPGKGGSGSRGPATGRWPDSASGAQAGGVGPRLVCRTCRTGITTTRDRISVSGSHAHTFFNPYGLVFHIGCFGQAPGCGLAGSRETTFSWFPGHAWQVALCRGCMDHLGWLFTGLGSAFFGLITDKLVEEFRDET